MVRDGGVVYQCLPIMAFTLPYFMDLRRKIQQTPSKQLKSTVMSMNGNCLKELLSIYCKYYCKESNRQQIKSQHHTQHIHNYIANKINNLKSKSQLQPFNSFTKIPHMLISYTFSFLDQCSRANASLVCYYFFKASTEPISISNLIVTKKFINNELRKDVAEFRHQKFSQCTTITFESADLATSRKTSKNYYINAPKLLNSKALKHIHWDVYWNMDLIFKYCDCLFKQADTLTLRFHYIDLIDRFTNIKSLNITDNRSISINDEVYVHPKLKAWFINNNTNDAIDISDGDVDVSKYIIPQNKFNLQHLELGAGFSSQFQMKCDKTTAPNPIFGLWNITTLQTCKMGIILPPATICKTEFEKLLLSSIVIEKARNQNFNKLSLHIQIPNERLDEENAEQLICNDLNMFLHYLNRIYQNLISIEYRLETQCVDVWSGVDYNKYEHYSLKLDWKSIFKNIQCLQIDVLTVNTANNFLSCFGNHELEYVNYVIFQIL
eukprot:136625_1